MTPDALDMDYDDIRLIRERDGNGSWNFALLDRAVLLAEVDRLNAELAVLKAEAWDAGYEQRAEDLYNDGFGDFQTPNPHRGNA